MYCSDRSRGMLRCIAADFRGVGVDGGAVLCIETSVLSPPARPRAFSRAGARDRRDPAAPHRAGVGIVKGAKVRITSESSTTVAQSWCRHAMTVGQSWYWHAMTVSQPW